MVRPCDKAGNDMADSTADVGSKLHGEQLLKVANVLHGRHEAYRKFMLKVSKHVVEAYDIHKQLKEAESRSAGIGQTGLIQKQFSYKATRTSDDETCRRVRCTSTMARYRAARCKFSSTDALESFIKMIPIKEACQAEVGITWLELYTLYRLHGHPKLIPDDPEKAVTRKSLAHQLRHFKRMWRQVVRRICQDSPDLALLSNTRCTPQPLMRIAIQGSMETFAFNIVTKPHAKRVLDEQLAKLAHKLNKNELFKFINGSRLVKPTFLKCTGRQGWDSAIPSLADSESCQSVKGGYCAGDNTMPTSFLPNASQGALASPLDLLFSCSCCGYKYDCRNGAFHLTDLDTKIRCKKCKTSTKIGDWKCICGSRRHICHMHQMCYSMQQGQQQPITEVCASSHQAGTVMTAQRAGATRTAAHFTESEFVHPATKLPKMVSSMQVVLLDVVDTKPINPALLSSKLRERLAL